MKPDGANSGERAHDLARDFALRAADHDRHATFPFENFDALKEAGLLGLTVPVEYGGDGAGLAATCEVLGTIAQGDASTALVLAMQLLMHATIARASSRWSARIRELIARDAVERG